MSVERHGIRNSMAVGYTLMFAIVVGAALQAVEAESEKLATAPLILGAVALGVSMVIAICIACYNAGRERGK